jgi:glycosyltransferase involved in cell wall biosynthesis
MKLIVQIPCFNEESTLLQTVKDIPRYIDGIDEIEVLIIDDGSTDKTVEVARTLGVDHILKINENKGLAHAFSRGLETSLSLGADIIVNTDGDNQYKGSDIPRLVEPILQEKADIVIGDRQIKTNKYFSYSKKVLQRFGSWVVRQLSGTSIKDTTSGFRAYSKEAALRMNIISPFTYTLESIIQAGKKDMTIIDVPIKTNKTLRRSRLYKSIPGYIGRQVTTLLRMYTMFQPLRVFFFIGITSSSIGILGVLRFLYFFYMSDGAGHIQSLVLSGVLIILGFILFMIGIVADIISFNRQLIEDSLYRVKKMESNLFIKHNNKEQDE